MQFVRDWMLIFAILVGIFGYFLYTSIPALEGTHGAMLALVSIAQPALIFAMLYLSFVRISPRDIRPCGWHLPLLLCQGGAFVVVACVLIALPHSGLRVVLEGTMICLICPTATAAAVVTRKLGGDMAHIITYTILINLLASLLIPAFTPLIHPDASMGVVNAALLILAKVFPLLLMPLLLAILTRKLLPGVRRAIERTPDLAFYLWVVSLTLAIAMTTRSIVHSPVTLSAMGGLVVASLLSCLLQFYLGRKIGHKYGDTVTAGQAFGQKNTVFAIWLGYTFFSPVTAVAGGFYSIWHNVINSIQLYKHRQK